jgi:site-specific DNA-methyltransferase (adenine-specific)
MNKFEVIQGDVSQGISLEDGSVQCVVTSPPYYRLRNYGVDGEIGQEKTPEEYIEKLVKVFREVKRVLCSDGVLWIVIGDSYFSSSDHPILKPKDLIGIPWKLAFALQADGWWLRSDVIWEKPACLPESVKDRPTRSHEYVFLFAKSENYYYDQDAIREPHGGKEGRKHSHWGEGKFNGYTDGKNGLTPQSFDQDHHYHPLGRNKRTVWEVTSEKFEGEHFATFPKRLITPCVLAGSKPGDLVFDPFCGSGTAGVVAVDNGRNFFGMDINSEYVKMAKKRIADEAGSSIMRLL